MPSANRKLGYLTFAILSFLVSLYMQFPFRIFLDQMLRQIEPQISPDRAITLQASDMKPFLITGVTIQNLIVKNRGETVMTVPKLRVRLRLLPLLTKTQSVAFSGSLAGGSISGTAGRTKRSALGEFEIENVNLSRVGPVLQQTGIPLFGNLNGKAVFDLPNGKPQEGTLKGEFLIDKAKLGPGQIYGFELQNALRLDDGGKPTSIKFNLEKGSISPSARFTNPDGKLEMNGKITFTGDFRFSPLDLQLTFGLGESIQKLLPSFIFTLPDFAQARNSDGTYTFRLRGTFSRPHWMPAKKV